MAPAIVETRRGADRMSSFEELDLRSRQGAALLRERGLRAGDPVLIFHPMSSELYEILLGVFRLGAVAMFLDPAAGRAHLESCCELQPPRALIAGPQAHLLRLLSAALRRVPLKFVIGSRLPGAVSWAESKTRTPLDHCEPCSPEVPALLTFTSGSTGAPKGTIRTHGFLIAQHRVLERHIKLVPGEVDLTTLPVFLLANLASGVTSVIPDADLRRPGFIAGGPVLAQMARQNVTRAASSPAFFGRLLLGHAVLSGALSGLRKLYLGGAPVFPQLLHQVGRVAPDAEVEAVYGSTEAEPIAHLETREIRPEDRAAMRAGNGLLAGKPIPEIALRILRDQWGAPLGALSLSEFANLQLPAHDVGEIVVSGNHVLTGYLGGRGNVETKFSVGDTVWHRTGDAGKLDSDGRLWLLGRCAARVEDARGRLYPFPVECVAREHPGVTSVAFVQHQGQRYLAVQADDAFGEEEQTALRVSLAWAGVDQVVKVKRLPHDARHNAKIDYPALRRLLQKLAR